MDKLPNTQFDTKEYDMSINMMCWIITCPLIHYGFCPYRTILTLDPEEVTKEDVSICGKTTSKRPYGELGSVDRSNCLCCVSVAGGMGEISPGCGCSTELVDEVVHELKTRMKARGDTAQIQRAELTMQKLTEVDSKLDLIMNHLNITPPPAPEPMYR